MSFQSLQRMKSSVPAMIKEKRWNGRIMIHYGINFVSGVTFVSLPPETQSETFIFHTKCVLIPRTVFKCLIYVTT